jgi:hypothetical protein
MSWEGCVTPYSSVVVSLVNALNNNAITFTPDSYSDSYGYVYGTFQTESNISPGPWYLNITDSATRESAEASFNMTNSTYSAAGYPTTTVPPNIPSVNSQVLNLSTLPVNLFALVGAIINRIS